MPRIEKNCNHCKYGMWNSDKTSLFCHRYPPHITEVKDGAITTVFIPVNAKHWCGEWKPATGRT